MAVTTSYDFFNTALEFTLASSVYDLERPALATLADGGFLFSYDRTAVSFAGVREADGSVRAAVAGITSTSTGDQFDTAVAGLSDGNAVIVFTDHSLGAASSDIRFRLLDANRNPIAIDGSTNDVLVTTGFVDAQTAPDVAGLVGGGFAMAWVDYDSPTDSDIWLRVVENDGSWRTAVLEVQDDLGLNTAPSVAALTGGGFVVAYVREVGGATRIIAEVFDSAGAPVGSEILVDSIGTINDQPAVIGTANGGFAVAYRDNGWDFGGGNTDITVARFDAGLNGQGYRRVNVESTDGDQGTPALVELSNGFLVVSWTNDAIDPGARTIDRVLLDASGSVVANPGGVFTASADESALTALANGAFVVAWRETGDPADTDVNARIQGARRISTGDAADDVIVGDGLVDSISGGGGNDVLMGAGADDVLNGGTGQDTALWSGARALYEVDTVFVAGQFRTAVRALATDEGTDDVRNVETFGFGGAAYGIAGIQQNATANLDGGAYNDAIFANATTGAVYATDLSASGASGFAVVGGLGALPAGWRVGATGDVSGDGRADLLIEDGQGALHAYHANDGWTQMAMLDSTWTLRGIGDFTRDGVLDPLFQRDDGLVYALDVDAGGAPMNSGFLALINAPGWTLVGVGDLDRDGASDLVIQNDADGTTFYANIDGGAVAGWGFVAGGLAGTGWQAAGVGDLNGDGFDDVVFRNANSGQIWAVDMLGGTNAGWLVVSDDLLPDWEVDGVLDTDNDGYDDVLVRQTSDGSVYAADMDAGAFAGFDQILLSPGADWSLV